MGIWKGVSGRDNKKTRGGSVACLWMFPLSFDNTVISEKFGRKSEGHQK